MNSNDVASLPNPNPPHKPTRYFLTDTTKREIIAAVALGESKRSVAQRFGCHPNTVSALCKDVSNLPKRGDSSNLESIRNRIDGQAVDAIELSVQDRTEIHKAASTGLAWLKGVGVLAGDGPNVTIQQVIASIPPEWRDDFVSTSSARGNTTTCSDGPPQDGATE